MRRVIPLNAVRAFEAAARRLSLTQAAAELHVTPTAISHQVRALEDFLQVRLFERSHRRLALTKAGRLCLANMTSGLDRLEEAVASLAETRRSRVVIRVSPSLASLWLLPRLPRFVAAEPDVDLVVLATADPSQFGNEDADVAIRLTRGNHPTRRCERLMSEDVVPVCAPSLLPGGALSTAAGLIDLPLIHDETLEAVELFPTWRSYLDAAGLAEPKSASLRFNLSELAVQAAIAGQGVLLGRSRLVEGALAARQLQRAIDMVHPMRFHYYLLTRRTNMTPAAVRLHDWLMAEAQDQ
jgi:LysR family glycine cleavage system transcriptional activator